MSEDPRERGWAMKLRAVGFLALLPAAALVTACSSERYARDVTDPGGEDAPPPVAPGERPYALDEVVVRIVPGSDVDDVNRYYGTWTAGSVESERLYLIHCPRGQTVDDLLPLMASNPALERAEPNYRLDAPEAEARTTSSMTFADAGDGAAAFADQGALRRIRAFEARALARGRGVTVAILDTGLDPRHPLLAGHVAPGAADLVDADADPSDVPDGVDSDADGLVDEAVGHGTAVAGLVLSVAPEAQILPVRILDSDGIGTAFGVARGLDLVRRRGADVVNMSFGMARGSRIVAELLEEIHDTGVVLVASAGNRNVGSPAQFPAGEPEVLGVAATDSVDHKADFSNFGPWISVSAPGVGLVTPAPGGSYAVWSGTSFSAALVSGEAALLRSAGSSVDRSSLARTIRQSVVPLAGVDPAFGSALGTGRIDVLSAVRLGMREDDPQGHADVNERARPDERTH